MTIRQGTGKRSAQERFPEVIAAAVRVFTRDGYRTARMSDVAREAGMSEAALYRYVGSKEGLFVLAIRHALLLEPAEELLAAKDGTAEEFPLKPPSLEQMVKHVREFVAEEVPFGSLAQAMRVDEPEDTATELESIMRELFSLEAQTREAADMIERSARELPELADMLNSGLRSPVLGVLTEYLDRRARSGRLRGTPDTAATARLVLETLTWFARHRFSDPYGAAIPDRLAEDTAVDALLHALVPPEALARSGRA
ncbi:MAG TPA: helix-turn-helix domain-containing protein [Trebonia sp.]